MSTQHENRTGGQRGVALGGGLALIAAGLHRGGLLGLVGVLAGGVLLARGARRHAAVEQSDDDTRQALASKARYAHMPLDSEVHSADFDMQQELPDTTPMGHETHVPPRQV